MMRITKFFTGFFLVFIPFMAFGQRNCSTHSNLKAYWELHPEEKTNWYQTLEQFKKEEKNLVSRIEGEVVIPVVVHVLYNTDKQNIPDSRIIEQIEALTKDYTATNDDISSVPNAFKPLIGSSGFRFQLANRDPDGNPTNGIRRIFTSRTSFSDNDGMKRASGGGVAPWDTKSYLNIWVCNLGTDLLGYAQFPGPSGGSALTDGVVINYRYFGINGAEAPFDLGRTLTHEVGHWLGLFHIWGDDEEEDDVCSFDDEIGDTPLQAVPTYNCRIFPFTRDDCTPGNPGIMFMNFMDYTDDACMHMFTQQQHARMNSVLNSIRAGLKSSKGISTTTGIVSNRNQLKISIFPNPNNGNFNIDLSLIKDKIKELKVINILGQSVWEQINPNNTVANIDLKTKTPGMYWLIIQTEDGSYGAEKFEVF
jgi:hypothetical protein